MKKKFKILFVAACLIAVCVIFNNTIIKYSVVLVTRAIVGAPVSIKELKFDLPAQEISVKGFKIYSPKGFGEEPLIDLAEARAEYNMIPLLWGKVHFLRVSLDIRQITVVENEAGVSNIDSLKFIRQIEASKKEKKINPFRIKIDSLRLNIHQLIQITHRESRETLVKVYDSPIRNRVYRNVSSVQQLVVLIISKAITRATIKAVGIKMAAAYLGVNSLPVSVAGFVLKKDNTSGEWPVEPYKAYDVCFQLMNDIGRMTEADKATGTIKGKIYGAGVTVWIEKTEEGTRITVKARKYMLPRRELAAGILYQIAQAIEEIE